MIKVITYGTFDHLHQGHINLLRRAKALGDYLIVGVTSDDFDKQRGKINVSEPLEKRIENVKQTGYADMIIVEEYEGQKIDDVKRFQADIFAIGSDWEGHFDYLKDYCEVNYLPRTQGISSTQIRTQEQSIRIGITGMDHYIEKVIDKAKFVNGLSIEGVYTTNEKANCQNISYYHDYTAFLNDIDAVYVYSHPTIHYKQVLSALKAAKHVMCEAPLTLNKEESQTLFAYAKQHHLILLEVLRTAYSTAFARMLLLVKSGKIGEVKSIDATCTSLESISHEEVFGKWASFTAWGPTALLPLFEILGTNYHTKTITTQLIKDIPALYDTFTKVSFIYPSAVASIKVGNGVKSEGELIISGTKGYVYIPAPWWKTDYFEIRYENPAQNKRYFYQLDDEGIPNEFITFIKAIKTGQYLPNIDLSTTLETSNIMNEFYHCKHFIEI